jgi:hypothetical protein
VGATALIPQRLQTTEAERRWLRGNRSHDITKQLLVVANGLETEPASVAKIREWNRLLISWRETREQNDFGVRKRERFT